MTRIEHVNSRQESDNELGIVAFLVLVATFCGYGFVASFEPGAGHIYYRIGYAVVGIACLALAAVVVAAGRKRS